MRRTQIYLTDDQAELLEGHSRTTGQTMSELIRAAIDAVYARGRAPSRAERLRIARRTAGAWSDFDETGAEYVDRIRGRMRLSRAHADR